MDAIENAHLKTQNRSLNGASSLLNFALSFMLRAAHEISPPVRRHQPQHAS